MFDSRPSAEDEKRNARFIRSYGAASERHRRQILSYAALGLLVTVGLLVLQASLVGEQLKGLRSLAAWHDEAPALAASDRHGGSPHVEMSPAGGKSAVRGEQQPSSAAQADTETPSDESHPQAVAGATALGCPQTLEDALERMEAAVHAPGLVSATVAPDSTRWHLDRIMALTGDAAAQRCLAQVRAMLTDKIDDSASDTSGATAAAVPSHAFFYDLGCRELDQTKLFLKRFPQADAFGVHCFEPNPQFTAGHAAYARMNPSVRIAFYDAAAGVANGTAVLSDRSVGSSVVKEPLGAAAVGGRVVAMVDFTGLLVRQLAAAMLSRRPSYVVLKMDIEKMEFAVLHRLLETHALALVDDLLLECHYNTNLSPALRDPAKHIGLDDCRRLVERLGTALQGNERGRAFEAVLWNNAKTAMASGYVRRHNGFHPS